MGPSAWPPGQTPCTPRARGPITAEKAPHLGDRCRARASAQPPVVRRQFSFSGFPSLLKLNRVPTTTLTGKCRLPIQKVLKKSSDHSCTACLLRRCLPRRRCGVHLSPLPDLRVPDSVLLRLREQAAFLPEGKTTCRRRGALTGQAQRVLQSDSDRHRTAGHRCRHQRLWAKPVRHFDLRHLL